MPVFIRQKSANFVKNLFVTMASFGHFVSYSSKTKSSGAYQRYIYKAYIDKNADTSVEN